LTSGLALPSSYILCATSSPSPSAIVTASADSMLEAKVGGHVRVLAGAVGGQRERLSHQVRQLPQIDGEFPSQRFRIMVALTFRCEIRNIHEALRGIVDPARQFVRLPTKPGEGAPNLQLHNPTCSQTPTRLTI
jgi:hypothetical protein